MEQMKSSDCPHHRKSENHHKNIFLRLFFPLIGLASVIWMLIRIIPKPSRAEYPCMKVAAPIASGFLVYIVTLIAALFSFQKARTYVRNSRYALASIFILIAVLTGMYFVFNTNTPSFAVLPRLIRCLCPQTLPTVRWERQGVFFPAASYG